MFVDASAIVAILSGEAEAEIFENALDKAAAPITSSVAVFEAVLALARKKQTSLGLAEAAVWEFMADARIATAPMSEADSGTALDACARYGKGRGHPAQLNMGDCFAYAVAKNRGVALLFKGPDFTCTDIAQAIPLQ
jgi:ribonuclease VapC